MNKTTLFLCCISVLLSGCGNRNKPIISENNIADTDKIYFLDFEQIVRNTKADTFTINSIAKNITFIPLETTDEALLSTENIKVEQINERYYISWSRDRIIYSILEFDSSGHFSDSLIQRGQGPKELPMILFWSINHSTQQLLAASTRQMLIHSFVDNNTKDRHNFDDTFFYMRMLNDGTLVGFPSFLGDERTANASEPYIHFRNQEGALVHSLYYPKKRDIHFNMPEGSSATISEYRLYPGYTGDALFEDRFNDTIYRISGMEDDIRPYIILHRGSLAPTVKDATNETSRNQKVYIYGILETYSHIFVKYVYRRENYCVLWDKQTGDLIANTKADNSSESNIVKNNWNSYGFTKYRMPTGKEILIAIMSYSDGKLYSVVDAEQAMEFLPGIVYDDNPVLMIIDI